MKAIRILSAGNAKVVTDAAKPKLRPDYILVKVHAVALNPTDWKHIGFIKSSVPITVGCDYAGVVEAVGDAVTKPWKVGDRVCGVVHGSNESEPDGGSFAEYAVAKGDLQIRIPDQMSFEEAATLGMGVSTVGQGMFQALGLPLPDKPVKEKFPVLIYGGSSSMGAYGIQYGVASGLEVVTTASSHNFDYVKSLGAAAVFDYKSPSCGADVRKATNNKLYYAWDAIGEGSSSQICGDALSDSPPSGQQLEYATVLQSTVARDDVKSTSKLMYTTFNEDFVKLGRLKKASSEDYEFMKKFVAISEPLIHQGKIKPHNVDIRPGGLEGVLHGLADMRDGKVSAKKLVYKVID